MDVSNVFDKSQYKFTGGIPLITQELHISTYTVEWNTNELTYLIL